MPVRRRTRAADGRRRCGSPATHEFLSKLHPVGRMGEVGEVVDAVLYLERAGFVTGETINVDGGQHAGRW